MAQVIVTESSLENIASAIRGKLNTQDTYKPSEMAGAISQIHGDPVLEALDVRANGTYTPSSGKDGFSRAVVNVPNSYTASDEGKVVSSGALVAQSSQGINSNGTYDTTLKNQVVVNVPNSYSASDEGKVVSNGALVAQGRQTITQNGTYDTTLINELIANISGGGGGGSKNILGGTTNPTSADGTDGDIYIKYTDYSDLSGYTPLEYIQSSGTQFITTDYTPNVNTEVKIELSPQVITDSAIMGADWTVDGYFLMFYQNKVRFHTTAAIDSPTVAVDERYIIETDKSGFTLNGARYNGNTASSFANYALSVFGTTHNPYPQTNVLGRFKLYSFVISESGTIVKNLIPAKRDSDDALGMYDLVNDVFYTNSGTGSFIGGEEKSGKPIDSAYLKVSGAWIPLEDGDWDDVNTGE